MPNVRRAKVTHLVDVEVNSNAIQIALFDISADC